MQPDDPIVSTIQELGSGLITIRNLRILLAASPRQQLLWADLARASPPYLYAHGLRHASRYADHFSDLEGHIRSNLLKDVVLQGEDQTSLCMYAALFLASLRVRHPGADQELSALVQSDDWRDRLEAAWWLSKLEITPANEAHKQQLAVDAHQTADGLFPVRSVISGMAVIADRQA